MKEINQKQFEELCKILCTKDEICNMFDTNERTLTRWCEDTYGESFFDAYKRLSSDGKCSLRRLQFKSAQKGNVTMQIWLGKQLLGQSDKQEITGKDGGAIELNGTARERIESRINQLAKRGRKKEDI